MLFIAILWNFIHCAFATIPNAVFNQIPQYQYLNRETTIEKLISQKICTIVQIKLSSNPIVSLTTEDNATLVCAPNSITHQETFLNLEFKNDKLTMINLIIPLNKETLKVLIETSPDWIKKTLPDKIVRDKKHYTIFNSKNSSVNFLEQHRIVSDQLTFKKIDEYLLGRLTKKSLPFIEKNRKSFFENKNATVVWQWFDLPSLSKGTVTYNNESTAKMAIISIETKFFDQDSFL